MTVRTDYDDLANLSDAQVEVPFVLARTAMMVAAVSSASDNELDILVGMVERRRAILAQERADAVVLKQLVARKTPAECAADDGIDLDEILRAEESADDARYDVLLGMSNIELMA